MIRIATIALAFFLVSCGPASKLRRAERLIKKAEEQGATWHADTVWTERVVFVPETRVDSIVVVHPGDSVVIFKDRVEVKIKRLRGDSIFVAAKCDTVKITMRIPVVVEKEITAKGWLRWWHLGLAFLVGAVVGRFVIRLLF